MAQLRIPGLTLLKLQKAQEQLKLDKASTFSSPLKTLKILLKN